MKTKNKIYSVIVFSVLVFNSTVIPQVSSKEIFDLVPAVPKNYYETFESGNCADYKLATEHLMNASQSITPALQQLQPKVQNAIMSNPMIMTNESLLNLMQYGSHEYFTDVSEDMFRVKSIVEEKRRELVEKLEANEIQISEKHNCGQYPAGSPQEQMCDNKVRGEIFETGVAIYNTYLTSVKQDLVQFHEKLRKFIYYIDSNIKGLPDKSNDAVRFYIYDASTASNLLISNYLQLIDIHCPHPEFIKKPDF